MQLSEHFDLREFVGPSVWEKWGSKAIWFIDQRLLRVAETIRRELQKPVVINDWHVGGHYRESGLRVPGDATYKQWSQHSYGRAIDVKVEHVDNFEVFKHIFDNSDLYRSLGVGAVENPKSTPGWTHADLRYNSGQKLLVVDP